MKKLISLFAALAMTLTLFTSVAFAAIPGPAELHLDINPADEDQIDEYLDTVGVASIPEGYTLFVVGISQSGLGAFTNTNSKATAAQVKKPTGFLPIGMTFMVDFDAANFAHIYNEDDEGEDYFAVVGNKFNFKPSFSSEDRTIAAYISGYENGGDEYPLNANGKTSIAENETIVEMYILVNATTVGTLNPGTVITMADMEGGANKSISGANVTSNQASYAIENLYLTCDDDFELEVSGGSTPTYTIAFQDWNGTSLGSNTYEEDATVTAPADPTRAGYNFTGWSPAFSATAAANVTYTAQYTPILVSSITLDKAALALTVGNNGTVAVSSVLPANALDKTYTWSSDATGVATVEGGTVTAVAVGTAHIRATANDGSGVYGECTVTVSAAAPADIVPAAADKDTYSNASTGLKDAFGKDVTIDSSRSYGAAKFDNVVLDDGEYVYKVFATGINKATGLEETKSWDVVDGSVEITGANVSFIAIVRSATHTITSVVLKAFAK